jgi:thiol-disulfide isomerase/thioredoxin
MLNTRKAHLGLILAICLYLGAFSLFNLPIYAATPETTGVQQLTAAQLSDWLKGKPVAFVEYYSPSCPVCVKAGPVLEKLATELSLHLAAIDVNLRENEVIIDQLGLEYIPTIVIYVDGKPLPNYYVGFTSEAQHREFFKQTLATYQK